MLLPFAALNKSVSPSRAASSLPLNRVLGISFAGVLLTLLLPSAIAQEPTPEDIIRVRTDLVTVPAVVLDSRGNRVFGLKQEDFVMRDEGRGVRLDHFSTGTEHVALAFLLDASGSAQEYVARQREAALALFSRFGTGSEVAVLRFGERAEVAAPFTTDITKARSGFDFSAVTGQHTAIFDSAASLIHLFNERKRNPTERRIIILTSDGLDNASRMRAVDVIDRARAGTISFYVIHFPIFAPAAGHLAPRPPTRGFRDLAEKTGGKYFTVGDVKSALDPHAQYDLSAVFKSIADDLASQYLLGFYPGDAVRDGRVHRIELQLARNDHRLRVKTFRDEYSLK